MITKARFSRIMALALPIIGAMLSQNILNLVDTAMVGVLGPNALAGVGVGNFANYMAISAIIGLSASVQAMVSRRKGEGRENEMAVPLNGGLFLALVIGLPLSFCLVSFAPELFAVVNDQPEVLAEGVPYFEARLFGIVAVGMNFSFRGYFTGVSLTKLYLRTLLIMHATNVVLNYGLIFGNFGLPELGAQGAGIGTSLSLYLGTLIYLVTAFTHARSSGFLTRIPGRDTMSAMLRLSLPNATQQFLFATGFTVFFWIIGQVGTDELAASTVVINLILVAILPGMGLGLAALTLVGESLGKQLPDDAARWGWDVTKVGMIALGFIGLPALLAPDWVLSGFIHEARVVDLARLPLQLAGASMIFEGLGLVLLNALLGAGAAQTVMVVSIGTQWIVGLPLAWLLGPYLGLGILWVWIANAGYRVLQGFVFAAIWRRGKWAKIKL